MCDDRTEAENQAFLEPLRLGRRELGVGTGSALATMLTGCASSTPPPAESAPATPAAPPTGAQAAPPTREAAPPEPKTTSRMVAIETPDGTAEAFFVAPEVGRHPGVLVWPDVAGLRDAFEQMATRLASDGYAVLVVNPYYRSSKLPILATFSERRTDAGREKIRPMREALTRERVDRDGAAFVAWLDTRGRSTSKSGWQRPATAWGAPLPSERLPRLPSVSASSLPSTVAASSPATRRAPSHSTQRARWSRGGVQSSLRTCGTRR